MMTTDFTIRRSCFAAVMAIGTLFASTAHAQDRLGGHFGMVLPLVSHARSTTTTIADDAVTGWPMGVTVKTSSRVAFDLELVPVIQNEPLHVSLTLHPGILAAMSDRTTAGVRMAFDVTQASWGFTPLVNRAITSVGAGQLFAEMVAPIRFREAGGERFVSVGLGAHIGIGF
jgi:hypothetical protein